MCSTRIVSSFEILIFKNVAFSDRTFYRKLTASEIAKKKTFNTCCKFTFGSVCDKISCVCVLPFALQKKKKSIFHCVKNWPTTSITRSVSSRCDIWLDSLNTYPKMSGEQQENREIRKTYRKLNPFNSRNIVEKWINSCLSCFVVSTIS